MADAQTPSSKPSSAAVSGCGMCEFVAGKSRELVIAENDLWQVRSLPEPVPIPGWIMIVARRHVGGPFDFNGAEAHSFGFTLKHLSALLRDLTKAPRIYVAALGEAHPHLHCHLVPRTDDLPGGVKGFSVFDLQRQAIEGSLRVDSTVIRSKLAELAAALQASPLPRP